MSKEQTMNDQQMMESMERIRKAIQTHGNQALMDLGKAFTEAESKKEKKKSKEKESKVAKKETQLALSPEETGDLAKYFEKDSSGGKNFKDVFICPKESTEEEKDDKLMRTNMHFEKDGSGNVIIEELRGNFDLENHPKYKSGELSKDELFNQLAQEQHESEGPYHHGYKKITAKIDDENNFSISNTSGWHHVF